MSTCQDIITAAVNRSGKNRGEATADPGSELRLAVGRILRAYFAIGARVNPEALGTTSDVTAVSGVWPRPATADLVYHIENISVGEGLPPEVLSVVSYADRTTATGYGRIYRQGAGYRSVGELGDPESADQLRFHYAVVPAIPAATTTALDPLWPTAFDGLLVDELALYLALKDNRLNELAEVRASRDGWLELYLVHLTHQDGPAAHRRFAPEPMTPPARELAKSLLTARG